MSRNKKNRKVGNSEPTFQGQRVESSADAQKAREKKRKEKLKGNKAGNRNAVESKHTAKQNQRQANNDKRVGSKKPVALTVNQPTKSVQQPAVKLQPKAKVIRSQVVQKISPEKEILAIENNDRLNDLLAQMDDGQTLSQVDQAWADKQMQRHQALMKELGWLDEESGEQDLLQQFEDSASALDEFK